MSAVAPPPRPRAAAASGGGPATGGGGAYLPAESPVVAAHRVGLRRARRYRAKTPAYEVGVQLIAMERPARIIGKKGRAQLSSGGLVPGMPRPVRVGPVQVWPLYPSMPEPLKPVVKELQFLGKFVGKLWDLVNAPITFD